jgi:hypothetical protein
VYDERCADAGITITYSDPFVRWAEDWKLQLPGFEFSVDLVGFNENNAFRMASALEVTYFTAWSGFANGRHFVRQI